MSSLDLAVKDYPTEAERDAYSAYLSNPMQFPSEFRAWLGDWLAVNIPYIPISQISGYNATVAQTIIVNTRENVTSPERTWVDLASDGPTIEKLNPGVYFCAYGYQEPGENAGGADVQVGISVNGADPTRWIGSHHQDLGWSNWEAIIVDLTTTGIELNTLKLKYWFNLGGGADAEFQYRWLTAMRVT